MMVHGCVWIVSFILTAIEASQDSKHKVGQAKTNMVVNTDSLIIYIVKTIIQTVLAIYTSTLILFTYMRAQNSVHSQQTSNVSKERHLIGQFIIMNAFLLIYQVLYIIFCSKVVSLIPEHLAEGYNFSSFKLIQNITNAMFIWMNVTALANPIITFLLRANFKNVLNQLKPRVSCCTMQRMSVNQQPLYLLLM